MANFEDYVDVDVLSKRSGLGICERIHLFPESTLVSFPKVVASNFFNAVSRCRDI
jgi:hypothetical protein